MTQYLQVLRYARAKFHPDVVIISLQANDFLASIYGYANENGDFLQIRPNGTGWIEVKPVAYRPYRLRLATKHRAIFRYFYGNLGFRSRVEILNSLFKRKQEEDKRYRMNVDIQQNLAYLKTYRSLCLYVFGRMKQAVQPGAKLLLFMDTDRAALYEGVDPRSEEVYHLNETVSQAARELEIPFVDLTADFENDYKMHRQRFDFDIDNHWNEKGHQLVAGALTRFLKQSKWLQ